MRAVKIVRIVLIAASILRLVYGGFSYTKETHEVKIGSSELSVKDTPAELKPAVDALRKRCMNDRSAARMPRRCP